MSNSLDVSYHCPEGFEFTNEALKSKLSDCANIISPIPSVKEYIKLSTSINNLTPYSSLNVMIEYFNKLGLYVDDENTHDILMGEYCTEGEFRRVFCEDSELPKIPIVRFKQIWGILKSDYDGIEIDNAISSCDEDKVDVKDVLATVNVVNNECSTGNIITTTDEKKDLRKKQIEINRKNNGINSNDIIEIIKAVKDSTKPVGQWSDEELLKAYSPTCDCEVVDILIKRSQNRPFIIFSKETENIVDIESTLLMLRQARKGTTPNTYKSGQSLKRLYKAGVFPAEVSYECPLHPSVLLLNDGYCDSCGMTWNLNNYEAMQFARIVYELGEAPKSGPELRKFINNCNIGLSGDLFRDYPKAAMLFEEKKNEDSLPRLRRRSSLDTRLVSDPMNVNRKY